LPPPSLLLLGLAGAVLALVGTFAGDRRADVHGNPAGKVVGPPIRVGNVPAGVAFAAGATWVTSIEERTVTLIDPRSGEVVGKPIGVGTDAANVAVGAGAVWAITAEGVREPTRCG